ncbi:MAG: endonuclease, partial [Bacteroidales bacterium]|nr:endonuclease [Bacteroidales bacterium]
SRKPVFLAGDFNDTPDSPVIRQMSRDWTLLSVLGDSYSAKDPHTCIDYIFLLHNRAAVRVEGGAVATEFTSGDVAVASDHLPLYVDVVR